MDKISNVVRQWWWQIWEALRHKQERPMEIIIERFGLGQDSTLGECILDGIHEAFVLEDERRDTKIPGETCIPPGRYEIKLRKAGGMHAKYGLRFPSVHEGMLHFQDVPNFKWVYFHIGNDDDDTEGCPLIGEYPVVLPSGEFKVATSTKAYLTFYRKVIEALKIKRVFCTVRERVPAS